MLKMRLTQKQVGSASQGIDLLRGEAHVRAEGPRPVPEVKRRVSGGECLCCIVKMTLFSLPSVTRREPD